MTSAEDVVEALDLEPHPTVIPANAGQAARPLGAWGLASCTVAPAFSFDGFELVEAGPDDPPPTA